MSSVKNFSVDDGVSFEMQDDDNILETLAHNVEHNERT